MTINKIKDRNDKLKTKVKDLIKELISHKDETEILLYQKTAENTKLKLALKLKDGEHIPQEELTQLSIEVEGGMETKNNTQEIDDDAVLEEMIRAEEEMGEDPLDDNNPDELDKKESNDAFSQFLRENEIVEGDLGYCEGDPNFYEDEDST